MMSQRRTPMGEQLSSQGGASNAQRRNPNEIDPSDMTPGGSHAIQRRGMNNPPGQMPPPAQVPPPALPPEMGGPPIPPQFAQMRQPPPVGMGPGQMAPGPMMSPPQPGQGAPNPQIAQLLQQLLQRHG